MPPAPTRIVDVPPATCAMTTAVAALAMLGNRVDRRVLLATYDEGFDAFESAPGRPRAFDLWAALCAGIAIGSATPGT